MDFLLGLLKFGFSPFTSQSPRKKALHFGAGSIGRGFIGALLSSADYEVIFADVAESIIEALNKERSYNIHILDLERNGEIDRINHVSGILTTNDVDMKRAITEASIITTAVGPGILTEVALRISIGIKARRAAGITSELNIIACENLPGASSLLHEEVLKHLTSAEDKAYLDAKVGFPNCTVDRIVPPFTDEQEGILAVGVENFHEWIVEKSAIKGPKLDIPGMTLTDNLTAYIERKLFTLNTGHAICAYLGFLEGYATVDESLSDRRIEEIVRNAMLESGAALCKKHGFDEKEHEKYINKIQGRFRNPYIKDDVVRVGREPIRKLSPDDRLVGPVKMAEEFGLRYDNLLKGIAAALRYENPEDRQSEELKSKIKEEGVGKVVAELIGFAEDTHENREIVSSYEDLGTRGRL